MRIYADNAATTAVSDATVQAMTQTMRTLWGNPSSAHAVGETAADALREARRRVAVCLGAAHADEIIFTSGGSEADNQAILSAACAGARAGKRHIVSTAFEHHAVLRTLEALEGQGFCVTLLPVGRDGVVDPAAVAHAIRPDTALVSVMYANNEIGTVQPIRDIGRVCRERGVPLHTDAVQAVGHIPVDVTADCVDYLSLSAHKFHGPRGMGALYVRRGCPVTPLIRGGGQENGRRAGTENVPGAVGLVAALTEAVAALPVAMPRVAALRDALEAGLSARVPGLLINGSTDPARRLPGILSLCVPGISGEAAVLRASLAGICLSAGAACTAGDLTPSHVMTAIGRDPETALGALRLSLSAYTTQAEIEYILDTLPPIIAVLR